MKNYNEIFLAAQTASAVKFPLVPTNLKKYFLKKRDPRRITKAKS